MPSFAELTTEFLDNEFDDSPVRASGLGLTEYDERLDDLSEAAFERRSAADTAWLNRFRGLDVGSLGFDEQIDRRRCAPSSPPPDQVVIGADCG